MEFNTISVSDGITMGSPGMRASLVSREVIADSIELVARGNLFDALVILVGCDKTIPAAAMALARLDVPGLILYGGSIAPGRVERTRRHDPGRLRSGRRSRRRTAVRPAACASSRRARAPAPGPAAGNSPPTRWSRPASFSGLRRWAAAMCRPSTQHKADVAERAGALVMDVLARTIGGHPAIVTAESFENAIACVAATGGSTNAVLHLTAIAREAGVSLTLEDFDRISARVPLLADLKPGGRFVATDLHAAGGTRLLAQRLIDAGALHRQRTHRHRPDPRARRRRMPSRRRGSSSCVPCRIHSSRPAVW